jgi:hypothetical protein
MKAIGEVAENLDPFRDARQRLRDRIHTHQDAGSAARVVALNDEIRAANAEKRNAE